MTVGCDSRQLDSSMVRPRKSTKKDGPKAAVLRKKVVVEVDKVVGSAQAKDGNPSTAETSSKPGETHSKKRILTKAQRKVYPKSDSPSPEDSEPDSEEEDEEGGPQGDVEEEPDSPSGPSPPPEGLHQEKPDKHPTKPGPSTDAGKTTRGRHLQTYIFTDAQEAELSEWFRGQYFNRKLKCYKVGKPVETGGGNWRTRQKPEPNPKPLATFSHALGRNRTPAVARDS